MEWYFGKVVDDLAVSKYQELADGVPFSPEVEILSKWGTYSPENSVSPNKYFSTDTNTMEEEFNFNGFCNEDNIESSIQDKSHSSGSSIYAGLSDESRQRTAILNDSTDHQLDHFGGIEQLDDIFLDSLIEDPPGTEDLHESFYFAPESQYGVLLSNDLAAGPSLDLERNSSDKHITGSSKYLETQSCSPSVDCKHGEVVASPFIPCHSEHKFLPIKAPLVKSQVPSEKYITNELVDEESSLEESVLQELKMVMDQLTDETRICFRDALYRLAEKSKQHVPKLTQNEEFSAEAPRMTSHDINTRPEKKKATETETNVIDRAVASLMYSKMDLHVRRFPAVEVMKGMQSPMNRHFFHGMSADDDEWKRNEASKDGFLETCCRKQSKGWHENN